MIFFLILESLNLESLLSCLSVSWSCFLGIVFLYLNVSFFHFPLFPICSLIRPAFKMLCQMSFSFSNANANALRCTCKRTKTKPFLKNESFIQIFLFLILIVPDELITFQIWLCFTSLHFLVFCILALWTSIWNIISAAVTVATNSQIFFL